MLTRVRSYKEMEAGGRGGTQDREAISSSLPSSGGRGDEDEHGWILSTKIRDGNPHPPKLLTEL